MRRPTDISITGSVVYVASEVFREEEGGSMRLDSTPGGGIPIGMRERSMSGSRESMVGNNNFGRAFDVEGHCPWALVKVDAVENIEKGSCQENARVFSRRAFLSSPLTCTN